MRPCLSCGTATANGSRCPTCARTHDRTRRPSPRQRGYDQEYRRNRRIILADNPLCAICGTRPATTADHIVPVSRGGGNDLSNLQPACAFDNARKGNRP